MLSGEPVSVPVMTVPEPFAANERSTQMRGRCVLATGGSDAMSSPSVLRSVSSVAELCTETCTTGAASRNVERTRWCTLSSVRAKVSASTKSVLVSTMTPRVMPSASRMRKCSSVCGFQPSLAATTNMHASIPPMPASMLRKKRTWPGTSIKPICCSAICVKAKPRSMVSPRRFSSSQRSGSVPVRA